ncbi:MAG: bifunctional precorrin-2 dehydrogenase/sirohydrochlorin ferrochelatase, partial [Chloroflexi bacterium]|nr:bifunctional precorrin-2 dehydrogenase/sirohydrochlorin ferrochelatase [Chloroflexota bacterium]
MGYYPIFVEMQGRRVLLVGGGNVAHEKIGKLVDASADVTVVAPDLIEPVRAVVEEYGCAWLARPYESGDVEGFEVVMVATDDGAVNAQV